jgi:RNA polymerase sigma-70 factor, ECF subfamily
MRRVMVGDTVNDERATTIPADEDEFRRLVEPYRGELHAHCYRMLGSIHDADDALQDALLGAWRGLDRFEGRSSLRSWLYRIATNACLRQIERRPPRVLPVERGPAAERGSDPGEPIDEPVWLEPYPDDGLASGAAVPEARYEARESVELGFVAALQHLPARQRAVLILRDVLGFSGAEVASALDATPASVYSALQRAHATLDERLPELSQQATARALGDDALRRIVDTFVNAWDQGDVDAVVAMLTEDVVLSMPPIPTWFHGLQTVGEFLARRPLAPDRPRRLRPASANGQPAFAYYAWREQERAFVAHSITVLTLRGARIAEMTAFQLPELYGRFGLPLRVEPGA